MSFVKFIEEVAYGAGKIVREKFSEPFQWKEKTDRGDIVTEVDELSEKYIIDRISKEFPDDGYLAEESGNTNINSKRIWIIDPIDGTLNYMKRIPIFSISIAAYENGQVSAGVVYDPIHDEMFSAQRGYGTTVNGEKITIDNVEDIENRIITVSWVQSKADRTAFVKYIDEISKETSHFRRLGSAALNMAYIADGRLNAYLQGGLNPWDISAGLVIIEEAGGIVTDFNGNPINATDPIIDIVTACPAVHKQLMEQVINR
ncbi:MAG: inositol monophosphatase family protein [Armatimonadota bacterium]